MKEIGVFEAKTRLSGLLEQVRKGATFRITRRGHPIAELRPVKLPDHRSCGSRETQAGARPHTPPRVGTQHPVASPTRSSSEAPAHPLRAVLPSRGLSWCGFRIPGWLRAVPKALETTQRYALPISHRVVAGVV
ncbi:MAG: type II toxin-antitoxin system Phd/YefM family antitoxin [Verrucomicrobiales bacterium]|nr:type II toxin-antitoxin system Phd/YefM family antitoxin [Verrucomicrobiales bacterium]